MYRTELEAREATADIYDKLYIQLSGAWHERVERAIVLKVLGTKCVDRVLDAGCGTGRFILDLARSCKYVVAFDYSPRSVEIARAKVASYSNVSVCCQDINTDVKYYDLFDKVLCAQVLQHVDDPSQAVGLLYSYLKPEGVCVANVYNANCFFLGKLLGRRIEKQGKFSNGIPFKRYTAQELEKLFRDQGFQDVKVSGCVNLDWYKLIGDQWFLAPLAWIDRQISRWGISKYMGSYLVVRGVK